MIDQWLITLTPLRFPLWTTTYVIQIFVSVLAVSECLVIVRDGLPGRSAVEAPFSSFLSTEPYAHG